MLSGSVCPVGNTSKRERNRASGRRPQFLCRGRPSGRPPILLGLSLRCSQAWRFAFILTLDYGILADPSAPQRKPPKERLEEHEIQFLAEANLTPRHGARFSHAGRQRFPGAPFSRDAAPRLRKGLRATSAFGGRPAREYARAGGGGSHSGAETRGQRHLALRPRRERGSAERTRRQVRRGYVPFARLAVTRRDARRNRQRPSEIRH